MTAPTPAGMAERLMQEFYLSSAYDPKAARPADTVQAAIAFALAALAPVAAEGGERDEAFCEAYYDAHLNDAWKALREGKPFQINADGAISLIQQAASDRRALRTEPTGGGEGA